MEKIWSDVENEAIVNAYFVMLEQEQTGRDYSKTEHWRVSYGIIYAYQAVGTFQTHVH